MLERDRAVNNDRGGGSGGGRVKHGWGQRRQCGSQRASAQGSVPDHEFPPCSIPPLRLCFRAQGLRAGASPARQDRGEHEMVSVSPPSSRAPCGVDPPLGPQGQVLGNRVVHATLTGSGMAPKSPKGAQDHITENAAGSQAITTHAALGHAGEVPHQMRLVSGQRNFPTPKLASPERCLFSP